MKETLTLLYAYNAWGVYDRCTVPMYNKDDPFPEHFYRDYNVELENSREVFRKLLEVSARLAEMKVVPSRQNMDEIFPSLDDLLR